MSKNYGSDISRRDALLALGALAVSARAGMAIAEEKGESMKGIALQLYSLRKPARDDLAGTLKKVRDMGWEYVQWSGMPDLPAEEIRASLDTAGLKAIAAHCGVEGFETDFENQVKFWKTVGSMDVAPGGMMGDCRDSLEAWKRGAARLDAVGAKLREVGMRLSYHNHDSEFKTFPEDPRTKLDILYESTDPKNICAELDLAWVYVGGADPAATLLKYTNRCPVIHAKDLAKKRILRGAQFMPLGQGILNWDEIFAAGKKAGVEWWVYEQDNADRDIFECAQLSYDFLKKNLLS
ncbi:MAG: sugar phosphate isomerase/epimerase [Candidatus Hydrogenedentes bacterium]|nr:sugar phosphate isomerase/epimerase [Candidatus Hydrogenedentota bacterium]